MSGPDSDTASHNVTIEPVTARLYGAVSPHSTMCACTPAGSSAGGTTIPAPCGNASVYCPLGSTAPTLALPGYFTAPASPTNATDVMALAVDCPTGYWCDAGVKTGCPAGTLQTRPKAVSASNCTLCPVGAYCGKASATPTPCGGDEVYCPAGSSLPLAAGPGFFTTQTGYDGHRTDREPCSRGAYCPGDGREHLCPAGWVSVWRGALHLVPPPLTPRRRLCSANHTRA
jgi:hypothetical protein